MTTTDLLNGIQNRDDFIAFVRELLCTLKDQPSTWEHQNIASYLEALAAWTEDMDGYFQNKNEATPEQPTWKLLGEMLAAARVYE